MNMISMSDLFWITSATPRANICDLFLKKIMMKLEATQS